MEIIPQQKNKILLIELMGAQASDPTIKASHLLNYLERFAGEELVELVEFLLFNIHRTENVNRQLSGIALDYALVEEKFSDVDEWTQSVNGKLTRETAESFIQFLFNHGSRQDRVIIMSIVLFESCFFAPISPDEDITQKEIDTIVDVNEERMFFFRNIIEQDFNETEQAIHLLGVLNSVSAKERMVLLADLLIYLNERKSSMSLGLFHQN